MKLEIELTEKYKLFEEQKLLLEESLNHLSEGKNYSQEQVVEEFNQWLNN
jgi:hypothetical protein